MMGAKTRLRQSRKPTTLGAQRIAHTKSAHHTPASNTPPVSPQINNLMQQTSFSQRDVVQLQRAVGAKRARAIVMRQHQAARRRPKRHGQHEDAVVQAQPDIQREAAATQPKNGTGSASVGSWAYYISSMVFGPIHDATAYTLGNNKTQKELENKYDEMLFTRYNHRKGTFFSVVMALINLLAGVTEIITGVAGTLSLISFLFALIPLLTAPMSFIGGWLGEAALAGSVISFLLRSILAGMHLYDIRFRKVNDDAGAKKSFEGLKTQSLGMFAGLLGAAIGAPGSKMFSGAATTTAQTGGGAVVGGLLGRVGKKLMVGGAKGVVKDAAKAGAKSALKATAKSAGQAAAGAPGANIINDQLGKAVSGAAPQQEDKGPVSRSADTAGKVSPSVMSADPTALLSGLDQYKVEAQKQQAKTQADKASLDQARSGIKAGTEKTVGIGQKFTAQKSKVDDNQNDLLNVKSKIDEVDDEQKKNVTTKDIKRGEKAKDEAATVIEKKPQSIDEAKQMVERGRSIAEKAKNTGQQKKSWWGRFKSWFYRRIIGPLTKLFGAGKAILDKFMAKAAGFIGKITGLDKMFNLASEMGNADDKRMELDADSLTKQDQALAQSIQGADRAKQKLKE